jgi:hypothetical protein
MLFSPESGTERPDRPWEQGKLGKACTNRQEYTDTKNQDQRRCAPHKDIQSLQNFRHNASYKKKRLSKLENRFRKYAYSQVAQISGQ